MDLARCLFVPRERYAGSAIPMSLSHVEITITSAAGYFWFWPHEVSGGDLIGSWVPEVTRDGILVGVTCSGTLLTPGGYLEPIWRLDRAGHAGLRALGARGPPILAAVCLACAAAVYGFVTRKRWGYRLGVALLLANLAGDLVNVASGIERRALVGIPIVALLLWYLSSPNRETVLSERRTIHWIATDSHESVTRRHHTGPGLV